VQLGRGQYDSNAVTGGGRISFQFVRSCFSCEEKQRSNITPSLDLAALWEAHCRYEFDTRDVDATMATMVSEPYVNHIPTMTGASDTITSSVFTNIISFA
jgi:hypothetical protein